MVVDLTIVTQPQIGELLDAQRLHAVQLVHDSEAVKPEAAVGETVDILKAESVRTAMSDFHGIGALNWKALITTKQGPYTTHAYAVD